MSVGNSNISFQSCSRSICVGVEEEGLSHYENNEKVAKDHQGSVGGRKFHLIWLLHLFTHQIEETHEVYIAKVKDCSNDFNYLKLFCSLV